MKLQLSVILLFGMLFIGRGVVQCQKIYLSPSGNDANTGTIERPLASLYAARDKARELRKSGNISQPVEVIALAGEYFMIQPLFLTSDDSRTKDSPLIFKSEEDSKAILRGGIKLEDFEQINDHLWRVFVPQVAFYNSYFEQLYVNGQRAVRARTPNEGFYTVKNVSETVLEKGEGRGESTKACYTEN
ncbi:MAG TPA: hypothetical protein VMV47_14720 [Bacteroidales bacterium]|nr:hypothetical protein [Bacteroidales bacterium]